MLKLIITSNNNLILPVKWSTDLRNFIKKLLQIDFKKRINTLDQFLINDYMKRININDVSNK